MDGPTLATLVRAWRERALLTQEQLASRTGLGVRTIRRLESATLRCPRTDTVRLLAEALALTAAERVRLVAAARGEPAPDAQPVPHQLPAPVAGFAGRADQLRDLDALLAADADVPVLVVISAIDGTAGVGKTALAVHWAHRVAMHFPDGQLYVNLRGYHPTGEPARPAEAVRGFLDALGVPPHRIPADLPARTALYRGLLAGRRLLVVLDNAVNAEQVRPLLPGAPGCLTLVTSRRQLTGLIASEGARPLPLDLLSAAEAREMLAQRLGEPRVAAEPDAAGEIVRCCARLPLALAIAAAIAAASPRLALADVAASLREARLDTLDTGDTATDVRSVLSWSYRRLAPAPARLFRLLGLHPGPDLTAAAAASLAGTRPAQVRAGLDELTRANLLTEPTPGRYALHDLLREYAAERVLATEPAPARRRATRRLVDHYVRAAATADRLLDPDREVISPPNSRPGTTTELLTEYQQALAWFNAERPALLAVIRMAADARLDAEAWHLARASTLFLDRHGHRRDLREILTIAVGAAERLADPHRRAQTHLDLALVHARLSRQADAEDHAEYALRLFEELRDDNGQAHVYSLLGWVRDQQNRPAEALDHMHRAHELFRATEHRAGQANALNGLGYLHAQLGQYQQAVAHCRNALKIYAELGNRYGAAHTWDSLGLVYHDLDRYQQAVDCYRHADDLFQSLADRQSRAATLTRLGDAHRAAGDIAAARQVWERAIDIAHGLDDPLAERIRARLTTVS